MYVIIESMKVHSPQSPRETKYSHEEFSSGQLVFNPDNETQIGINVFGN
jgi:hypothetical protein